DPDRWVRRLRRGRLDDDVVEVPEAPVVGEPLARRPRSEQHGERLLEARAGLRSLDVEASELGVAVSLADTQVETTIREHVPRRRLTGEPRRVVPRQHDHAGPQADRRRVRRDAGLQYQRRGDLTPAAEVVLDQERGFEPQGLGLDVELDVGAYLLCVSDF